MTASSKLGISLDLGLKDHKKSVLYYLGSGTVASSVSTRFSHECTGLKFSIKLSSTD